MTVRFDATLGLVVVPAELFGPNGSAVVRLALDTGATGSVVNVAVLVALGYDPSLARERIQVTTGSGVEFAARVVLDRILALDSVRHEFAVLAHTLPPSAGVDGLLGLDFLRGHIVSLDFVTGEVSLA